MEGPEIVANQTIDQRRVGVTWNPKAELGLYASWGQGFLPKAYVDPTNVPYIDGFGLLNARLGYTFQTRGFQAEVFVAGKNLTNKEYIAFTEPDPDGNSYQPGPKREFFAGIRLEFK